LLGYNGGYCEDKCYCWRQVADNNNNNVVDENNPETKPRGISPEIGEGS
jgi:hypothetical protein